MEVQTEKRWGFRNVNVEVMTEKRWELHECQCGIEDGKVIECAGLSMWKNVNAEVKIRKLWNMQESGGEDMKATEFAGMPRQDSKMIYYAKMSTWG